MGYQKADDYVEVNERIVEFRTKYPEGSLQPLNLDKPYEFVEVGGQHMVVYAAAAYRSPDDVRPGVGVVSEPFPGKTPYTKGSELANAETSAWGRAIVAALAADTKRGIASAVEVRNRKAEQDVPTKPPEPVPAHQVLLNRIAELCMAKEISRAAGQEMFEKLGGTGALMDCTDVDFLGEVFESFKGY
jgi:hypothetical protein